MKWTTSRIRRIAHSAPQVSSVARGFHSQVFSGGDLSPLEHCSLFFQGPITRWIPASIAPKTGVCARDDPRFFPRRTVSIRYHSSLVQHDSHSLNDNITTVDDAVRILKSLVESRSTLLNVPQEADQVLQLLRDRDETPNFDCLYWAIECWSHTKRKGSEERIEKLYQQLWSSVFRKEHPNPTDSEKVKIQAAFLRVLHAYHHVSNAHRAEELLLQFADSFRSNPKVLLAPTLEMCKLVLSTWSRSESSRRATRAEKLVSIMTKDHALPNPDITCYSLVLNAWASSGRENAPRRAELLLRSMEFHQGGNESVRPNLLSYTCVLNAWARSNDAKAPDEAERLFHEMEQTHGWQVDRVVYTAMMSVWGRCQRSGSIEKAEEYFQRLKGLQDSTKVHDQDKDGNTVDVRVTVVEYTALIQAWANHVAKNVNDSRRAVKRVEELLDELMETYFSNNFDDVDGDLRPNRMTFASVLRTICSARRIPNREDKAKATLRKMRELKLAPNAHILALFDKCSRRAKPQKRGNEVHS